MNVLYIFLLCAAFAVVEFLIGGTRLLFSLPAYLVLAAAAVLSLADLRRVRVRPSALCLAASGVFLGYVLCRGLTSRSPTSPGRTSSWCSAHWSCTS